MKPFKLCELLAFTVIALMAFAGTASATTVTSSTGSTPTIHAESDGYTTFHGIVDIQCSSTAFESTVASHGPGVTAAGQVSSLTFSECGNNHVTVKKAGTIEVHAVSPTGNGTLTSSGVELSFFMTSLGITCVLTTSNTHIGTITSGEQATMHIDSAQIPRTGGSVFCGSSWEWTGSFSFDHPTGLAIH